VKKLLLSAALALGLYAPASFAQPIAGGISGNECWNAGQGPGGPTTGYMCAFMMRNGSAFQTFSGSGAFTTQMVPTQSVLYWVGTAPTSWTITTPATPFDGEIIQLSTDTTLTSIVTVTANTGQTLHTAFTSQTISAAAGAEFEYNLATAAWFRIR
jgi:hypothetical protein